ncbi:chorismate mutase [candidate division KSB1 bacterium]|nr:chorismate mutase [candidate division KSB1 bacterium]
MTIEKLRREIDAIDQQLLELFNARAEKAVQIGRIKTEQNLAVQDPQREQNVVARMIANNSGPLSSEQVAELYRQIFYICRSLQS